MNNIMIDIETLDNKPTSAIVSIGAVRFDRNGVDRDNTFYAVVDLQSCIDLGLTVSAQTLGWWMGQSRVAQSIFTEPGGHLAVVLTAFSKWVDNDRAILWGNGASFDNAIMSNAYAVINVEQPWKFWNDRCYRTIAACHPTHKRVQLGTHHNALHDATSQAEHLITIAPEVIV